ncbi:hypothetical protein SKAU_G00069210 [Synaphobranchus kaupii]|uniref:ribonuclease H n=1 Tax=Synaphobranchus kaupii TaxID=118154 RepID=A0A9Q1G7C6_SYNKA|nr:hypothetical protein SKAU_G00069210 [Synaphobranchus kaupii]
MELETGAAVSLISWGQYKSALRHVPLQPTDVVLKTYTGEPLAPEGVVKVQGLGTIKGIKARVTLKPDSVPKFCPTRNVPYALRPKVEAELTRLTELGVISPVEHSDWATPVVPVSKKDATVRLCGDFKVTINPALCVDKYPIPRIEDLFASLAGGQRFSKLDLSNAYLQMEVEEELFCHNRLPFGITSAPALFQKAMDQVLLGLPFTHCYLDDILVSGPDEETHLKTLDAVLGRLEEYGLHVKQEKCLFF